MPVGIEQFDMFRDVLRERKSSWLIYSNTNHSVNFKQYKELHEEFRGTFVFEEFRCVADESMDKRYFELDLTYLLSDN